MLGAERALTVGAIPLLVDRAGNRPDYGQAATVGALRELLDLVELAPAPAVDATRPR